LRLRYLSCFTVLVTDHLVSDPTKSVNLADSDVAEPVQQLIDAAADLARPSSV
jgi:hypothetical protein